MSLQRASIDNATVTWFVAFLLIVGGILAFFQLGQLEDPNFSIKTAVVSTTYPGASPVEVEQEVTETIEVELQTLEEIDFLESFSRAGNSRIMVNIKPSYGSAELPQIWDKVRSRVERAVPLLPPGASTPVVFDDFGDVFGLLLAITSDGFAPSEVERAADDVKRELSLVDGVARIDLWGVRERRVFVDVRQSRLDELGLSEATIARSLENQNAVVDGGRVFVGDTTLRISPTGEFTDAADIANVVLRPAAIDAVQAGKRARDEIIRLGDIGEVREGYEDPPSTLLRFNRKPAIALAIAPQSGQNVVEVGRRVDARLAELQQTLPIGLEIEKVHWQSDVIDESVRGFFVSLIQAVAIVLVVLTLSMGWRMGVVIGTALLLTVLGTFISMSALGIDLQRMSLGALVIALGMMVDNAIVVADGYSVRVKQGMSVREAALESSTQPSIPLLGATLIAVLAFYPIYASQENAGEYCATLFSVVGIALALSWLISVTITPLQCMTMLKPTPNADGGDVYSGTFYRAFRGFLTTAIRFRFVTIAASLGLLVLAIGSFGGVKQLFFPDSAMTKFMIDYWMPEGTRIERVSKDLEGIEDYLLNDDRVSEVASFIGQGPPRFYLPVEPESANPAYAQLIVNVRDHETIDGLLLDIRRDLSERYPDALMPLRKYNVGPGDTWKFELRISGPGDADPTVLNELGDRVSEIVAASPYAGVIQTSWRQPVVEIAPAYNLARASWSGVTRQDVARTTRRTYDGLQVGLFRDGDKLVPIVMRAIEEERNRPGSLDVVGVTSELTTAPVPLSQVVDRVELTKEPSVIARYDRRRTLTVQATPAQGSTFPTLHADVRKEIEGIELPAGYSMAWGGEFESSSKSQASLIPGVIPAVVIMILVMVALFNDLRPPIVILLTIPFGLVGVIFGLLFTGVPLGFVALLAAMSLAGMMIKNALVLIDEIGAGLDRGLDRYTATIEAAVSRLRPVVLAAATTVLGVVPLMVDVFWVGLSVTIMAGLSVGTIVTMILVPTFYTTIYGLRPPDEQSAPAPSKTTESTA